MKRKLLTILLVILSVLSLSFGLVACEEIEYVPDNNATKTATCDRTGCEETDSIVDEGAMVTFNVNNGNPLEENMLKMVYGRTYELPVPTHPQGYEFVGWYYGDIKVEDGVWKYSKDITLVAGWTQTYEVTYALYKHNAEYNGRVANTEDLVLDGYNNLTRAQIDEAKGAIENFKDGDILEIELTNSNNIYVVAKVKVVTGAISTAEELSKMIFLSVDEVPTGYWGAWGGYYVLTKDIDMAGYRMQKNGRPGTLFNFGGWGFQGTIDGAGHTVFNLNDTMFYQLGNWIGTIKNLSLINMTKPLATTLGGLTIDNCYFQFVLDVQHTDGAPFTHVLGDSIGDTYPRDVKISNSVIEVINNINGVQLNLINKINGGTVAGYENRNSTLTYENTLLIADSNKVGVGVTYGETAPTVVAEGATYTGNTDGFSDVLWNKEGKFPTFNSFVDMGVVEQTYYYGRYILDRENDNVSKINDQDLVINLDGGIEIIVDKELFNIGANGMNASPGSSKWTLKQQASDGKYYTVNVEFVNFAINDAVDLANIAKGLNVSSWLTGFGGGTIIGFNNDIDMTGVTMVNSGEEGAYAGAWGFKGTILGNGRTISNLNTTLIHYINSAATIKDLNFKNMGANGAIAYKSSGVQLVNVNFDIDAFGMSKVYLVNKTYFSRTATTLTNCSIKIKNASSSFVCYVDYGPNPDFDKGTITLNNVTVSMNDGAFKLASSEASSFDLTGEQVNTIVNGSLDKRN